MTAITRFERQMEKVLNANMEAMFRVPLGDSHQHAYVKGERAGLERALRLFGMDHIADSDDDDIQP